MWKKAVEWQSPIIYIFVSLYTITSRRPHEFVVARFLSVGCQNGILNQPTSPLKSTSGSSAKDYLYLCKKNVYLIVNLIYVHVNFPHQHQPPRPHAHPPQTPLMHTYTPVEREKNLELVSGNRKQSQDIPLVLKGGDQGFSFARRF